MGFTKSKSRRTCETDTYITCRKNDLAVFYSATFIRFIYQISLSLITKSSAMKFIWMRGVIMGLISSKKEYIGI